MRYHIFLVVDETNKLWQYVGMKTSKVDADAYVREKNLKFPGHHWVIIGAEVVVHRLERECEIDIKEKGE